MPSRALAAGAATEGPVAAVTARGATAIATGWRSATFATWAEAIAGPAARTFTPGTLAEWSPWAAANAAWHGRTRGPLWMLAPLLAVRREERAA